MSTTLQTIVNSARTLIHDTDATNYRWSDANMLVFGNEAARDICNRSLAIKGPPAYVATEVITLVAGTQQSLTTCNAGSGTTLTSLKLMDVVRNVGVAWVTGVSYIVGDIVYTNSNVYKCATAHTSGTFATDLAVAKWTVSNEDRLNIIYSIHVANLDALIPHWRKANTDNTGTSGTQVQYWMEHQFDDLIFDVYPQQPDSNYKMNIEVYFAAYPANLTALSDNIKLDDKYQDAMRDYIIHLAFAMNDEVDENGNTMSEKWFRRYLASPIFI